MSKEHSMSNENTAPANGVVSPTSSLYEFFQAEVVQTTSELRKDVPADTQIYLANLLARFASSDSVFVPMEGRKELEPLAFVLKRAVEAEDEAGRVRELKHLGDIALYTSGFFSDRIERRGVEVDYYIEMGGMAYRNVSDLAGHRSIAAGFRDLYAKLSRHFADLVTVLWELAERSRMTTARGLLELYQKWEQTGSDRLRRKLVRQGLILAPGGRAVC